MTVNYRHEPIALRVRNPANNSQAGGLAGDLSYAFSSSVDRADNAFDVQPDFYQPLTTDMNPRDPWTPLLRAYDSDRVQIRIWSAPTRRGTTSTCTASSGCSSRRSPTPAGATAR